MSEIESVIYNSGKIGLIMIGYFNFVRLILVGVHKRFVGTILKSFFNKVGGLGFG